MRSGSALRSADWCRVMEPRPGARTRLVCFPYAGGSANIFRGLAGRLPASVEVVGLQYPGRQDRHHEAPIRDLATLADQIVTVLGGLPARPTAFFGHSLGATVAFETARRLLPRFPTPLVRLFASAKQPPHESRPGDADYSSDEDMRVFMRRLGGTAARAADDEDLWPIVVPALRSDLQMSQDYRYTGGGPLTCPITALAAQSEPGCTLADVKGWAECTIGPFEALEMPGGHYYIDAVPAELVALVSGHLDAAPENTNPNRGVRDR